MGLFYKHLQAEDIFAQGDSESLRDRLMSASDITSDVLALTESSAGVFSLLPSDLNSTNRVLGGVIGLLEESLGSDENTTDLSNSDVLDIFSSVLEGQHLKGWIELTEVGMLLALTRAQALAPTSPLALALYLVAFGMKGWMS